MREWQIVGGAKHTSSSSSYGQSQSRQASKLPHRPHPAHPSNPYASTIIHLSLSLSPSPSFSPPPSHRRKQVTKERKAKADEKARLEVMASKVSFPRACALFVPLRISYWVSRVKEPSRKRSLADFSLSPPCLFFPRFVKRFLPFRSRGPLTRFRHENQMSAKKLQRKKKRMGLTKKVAH